MVKNWRLSVIGLVALVPSTGSAFHSAGFGIQSAAAANRVLSASPPLPMLYYAKGDYRVTLQPSYFFGERDAAGHQDQSGAFRGLGAGASASYAVADRWGVYGWAIGSVLEGDFRNVAPGFITEVKGVRASFTTLSVGLVYQVMGRTDGGFSLPVFLGPTVSHVRFSQTVVDSPVATPQVPQEDFDMDSSHVQGGFLAGIQAGIDLGKSFRANPFLVGSMILDHPCKSFRVTAQRTGVTALSNQGSPECGEASLDPIPDKRFVYYPRSIVTGGINLAYKPWRLSVNVTAPFLTRWIAKEEGTALTMISVSHSFGSKK